MRCMQGTWVVAISLMEKLMCSCLWQADAAKMSCGYCNSQHTQLDYALHRLSNNHVKKVQKKMVYRGFTSACLVCNCALKDLKQVEVHIQENAHSDRMKSFLVDSYLCTDKCTCRSCGITFYNEMALEAHCLLLPSHNARGSSKLDELSRLLSGLHARQFAFGYNRLCHICDATFPGIEDLIMHLFTASHISRLRSSSCMVCKKDFTHASDRELHINSTKHHIIMRKCRDLLDQGQVHAHLAKGGYPCMLCMIWCNSWFCLELHLLDKHHEKVSAQSKANRPMSGRIVFSAVSEGTGQIESCDESTMNSWRQWRSDALEECVWCHRCGVSLSSIDEVDDHLNTHSIDRCSTLDRSHTYNLSNLAPVSKIFSCSTCAVSFRNAFMLVVHEASFEHHSRLAVCLSTHDVQCCPSCGLVMSNGGDSNGALEGSLPQTKRAEVSLRSLGLCEQKPRAKNRSNVRVLDTIMQARSSAEGSPQTADKVSMEANCFLVPDKKGDNSLKVSRGLVVGGSVKAAGDAEGANRLLSKNGFLMNDGFCTKCTRYDDHERSQLGGAGHASNLESVRISRSGIVAGKSSTGTQEDGTDHLPPEVLLPNAAAYLPLDDHLQHTHAGLDKSFMQQNPLLLADQVPDGHGSEESTEKASFADTAVPIVVAATFAPLGTLQESLQSMAAIVTESLSSALPAFYMQQPSPGSKRKSEASLEEETCNRSEKRMCLQRILGAALHRGLQTVWSNAVGPIDVDVQCQALTEKENVRLRTGDGKDVDMPQAVLALAASIIPNGLQDPSRPSSMQVQAEGNKVHGSSAVQSDDGSNKKAQESTEVRSESLSQVEVGGQGLAGSIRGKTVVEEHPNHVQSLHRQLVLRTDAHNVVTSMPVSLANGTISSIKDEVLLPAKKLAVATRVAESCISKESKSNDDDSKADDDYYAFLDPTKGQLKWWSSSDSEDSDSVCK